MRTKKRNFRPKTTPLRPTKKKRIRSVCVCGNKRRNRKEMKVETKEEEEKVQKYKRK